MKKTGLGVAPSLKSANASTHEITALASAEPEIYSVTLTTTLKYEFQKHSWCPVSPSVNNAHMKYRPLVNTFNLDLLLTYAAKFIQDITVCEWEGVWVYWREGHTRQKNLGYFTLDLYSFPPFFTLFEKS